MISYDFFAERRIFFLHRRGVIGYHSHVTDDA